MKEVVKGWTKWKYILSNYKRNWINQNNVWACEPTQGTHPIILDNIHPPTQSRDCDMTLNTTQSIWWLELCIKLTYSYYLYSSILTSKYNSNCHLRSQKLPSLDTEETEALVWSSGGRAHGETEIRDWDSGRRWALRRETGVKQKHWRDNNGDFVKNQN